MNPEGMTRNQARCGRSKCLESGELFGNDLGRLCFYDGSLASSQTLRLMPLTIRKTSDGISNRFSDHNISAERFAPLELLQREDRE